MSVDVSSLFFTPGTVGALMFGVASAGSAAMGVAMLVPRLSRKLMPLPKETRLVDFMPFLHFLKDGATILTKRGDYVRVLKLAGAEMQVASKGEQEQLYFARRTWLTQLAEKGARARIFTIRSAIRPGDLMEHPVPHLKGLANKWEQAFERNSFMTEHYAIISTGKDGGEMAIEEACNLTISGLNLFKPKLLGVHTDESPLKILARLASPISRPNPKPIPGADVSEQITADTVHFSDDKAGSIVFSSGSIEKHVAILGIKSWGDLTEEKMLQDLASLPFDYTIFHHIEPLSRAKATAQLDVAFRFARTTYLPQTAAEQFEDVREIVAGGGNDSQSLCNYALNILVEGPDEETLIKRISDINTVATQYQVTTVREGIVSHPIWWSMFPTFDTMARPWKPLASNVALLLAMQRNSPGSDFSPWGKSPVTLLRTAVGSPYKFVFHDMSDPGNKEPLGHMLVVGPSGSGKTVTVSWLAMMAMRYPDLRVFFFDRFFGTEVVTNMCGGRYIKFDGSGAAMNPLQMDLNDGNRDYLNTWLRLITGLTDSASAEQFGNMLEMLELMPREARNLKKVWQTSFAPDSDARSAIRPWINDNQYGSVFCAPEDSLDLSNRMLGFDFTTILDPERADALGPAVVSYIMHRTMDVSVKQGHPALYFVDETAPLLKNDYFAHKFSAGLKEGRKLGQVFICAFQTPSSIIETGHAQTIMGQCATQIFFPNPKAKAGDLEFFNMTSREIDFCLGRTHNHLPRKFLLRRVAGDDIESIVIDADMRTLGDGLATFASGNASVRMLREMMEKDPENFRQLYMDRVAAERAAA